MYTLIYFQWSDLVTSHGLSSDDQLINVRVLQKKPNLFFCIIIIIHNNGA